MQSLLHGEENLRVIHRQDEILEYFNTHMQFNCQEENCLKRHGLFCTCDQGSLTDDINNKQSYTYYNLSI